MDWLVLEGRGGNCCCYSDSTHNHAHSLTHSLTHTLTAALQLTQGRLSFADNSQVTFTVEGVATVELGGASQPIYYFDCSSTTNNGSGEREEREESKNHIPFAIQCHCICSLIKTSDLKRTI